MRHWTVNLHHAFVDGSAMTLIIHRANLWPTATLEIEPEWVFVSSDPVEFKYKALCLELTSTRVPISRHARRRVLQGRDWLLEVKERGEQAGWGPTLLLGVVTEIARGRKRRIQTQRGRDFLRGTATFNVGIWNTCRKIERASRSAIYVWHWVADEMIGSVKSSCCSPGSSGRPASEREFQVVACVLLNVSTPQKPGCLSLSLLEDSSVGDAPRRGICRPRSDKQSNEEGFRLSSFLSARGTRANVIDCVSIWPVHQLSTSSVKSGPSMKQHLQVALAQRDRNREPIAQWAADASGNIGRYRGSR